MTAPVVAAPPARWRRALAVLALVVVGLAGAAWALSDRVVDALCARWDAQVEAELAALAAEGLAVTEEALAPPPGADDGRPALAGVIEAARLSPVEREALALDLQWRQRSTLVEPGQPAPPPEGEGAPERRVLVPVRYEASRHRALVASLLARIDALTPALDSALASGAWRVAPLGGSPPRTRDLAQLLELRQRSRGGPGRWRDLAREARLAAARLDHGLEALHARDTAASTLSSRLAWLLSEEPLEPGSARALDASLQALDQPDAMSRALRVGALRALRRATPDDRGLILVSARVHAGHSYRRRHWQLIVRPAYHLHRARWLLLEARAIRATHLAPRPRLRAALEEVEAEQREEPANALMSTSSTPYSPWVERATGSIARARLARMALALALAAGDGPLPDVAPLSLEDPFTDPPRPLAWRCTGRRTGVLSSVDVDGQDDGAAVPTLDGDGLLRGDLLMQVALPGT